MTEPFNPETHFEAVHGWNDASGSGLEIVVRMPLGMSEDRKIMAYTAMQDAVHTISDAMRP